MSQTTDQQLQINQIETISHKLESFTKGYPQGKQDYRKTERLKQRLTCI